MGMKYYMYFQKNTGLTGLMKWWYRSTYVSDVKLYKLRSLPVKGQNYFLQAIQITSKLHYPYYAGFSSRILTFNKTSYWQGAVLHIDSNPSLRQVA